LPAKALPADCSRSYKVNDGDTCDIISAKESVSTYQLALVNKGVIDSGCDNLFVGEVICLGIIGQDCTTVHTVKNGNTCDAIEEWAGIDFATLLANNKNINNQCSNLRSGEVLCTASSVIPYSG
ncbi:hypothetical protein BDY19DRAFT_992924, partial [Irpex rosettiformis]